MEFLVACVHDGLVDGGMTGLTDGAVEETVDGMSGGSKCGEGINIQSK